MLDCGRTTNSPPSSRRALTGAVAGPQSRAWKASGDCGPRRGSVADNAVPVRGQCDERTARDLTREIKKSLEQSWTLIKEAFKCRAWAALGYESWESYCDNQLGTGLV